MGGVHFFSIFACSTWLRVSALAGAHLDRFGGLLGLVSGLPGGSGEGLAASYGVLWRGLAWHGVAWRGVVWRGRDAGTQAALARLHFQRGGREIKAL